MTTDKRQLDTRPELPERPERQCIGFGCHVGFPIKCQRFYADEANFKKVAEAIRTMSLRSLEFTCLNYAKKHDVVYEVTVGGKKVPFNLYLSYRAQLLSFGKRYFDLFCRKTEDVIEYSGLRTTPGQLNFFHWAFTHGVIEYYTRNRKAIEKEMKDTLKERKAAESHKRRELSKAAIKKCVVRPGSSLSFD